MGDRLEIPHIRIWDICCDVEGSAEIFVLLAEIFVLAAEIFVLLAEVTRRNILKPKVIILGRESPLNGCEPVACHSGYCSTACFLLKLLGHVPYTYARPFHRMQPRFFAPRLSAKFRAGYIALPA